MSNVAIAREKIDKILGSEPKPKGQVLDNAALGRILNWYATNKDSKDAVKYAKEYLTKQKIKFSGTALTGTPRQFGFICRVITNGGIVNDKDRAWFEEKLASVVSKTEPDEVSASEGTTGKVSIQERIAIKSDSITAELEGMLDDFIASGCTSGYNPRGLMVSLDTKQVNTKRIIEIFKKYRSEFDAVSDTTDEDVKESYSNFSKVQLRKLVAFCDQVIKDASTLAGDSVNNRKPRKVKVKSPEVLVSKLNYVKEFDLEGTKLTSVDPKGLVGASQVFVYNTKTKKLGVYLAEDGSGISVKGSTLTGFSTTKSVAKTLRKPKETIGELLKAGKVALRTTLSKLTTKESVLTGRLNVDTIILKIT